MEKIDKIEITERNIRIVSIVNSEKNENKNCNKTLTWRALLVLFQSTFDFSDFK